MPKLYGQGSPGGENEHDEHEVDVQHITVPDIDFTLHVVRCRKCRESFVIFDDDYDPSDWESWR